MSYCRMGPRSDVYMFDSVSGFIECCMCSLGGKLCRHCGNIKPPRNILSKERLEKSQFKLRSEAIKHLLKHKKAGHKVPVSAIKQLQLEIRLEGDELK